MKLKTARIRDFKRFVDLTIRDLPPEARLVVLLGPNGCGKSSLFDAFQRRLKVDHFFGMNDEFKRYYWRSFPGPAEKNDQVELEFHGPYPTSEDALKRSLYLRSAYRHEPSFRNTSIEQQPDVLDRHAVRRLIDTDRTVQDNFQRLVWRLLRSVTTPGLTTDQIMSETIGDLQKSMGAVFGDIQLNALVAPGDTGTFTFSKGESKNFLYENLSAGEKAAFDLLLDVVVNRAAFDDSLYCIDEPEAHLSTKLQGALLRELFGLISETSQLWLATHSIGMVRAAQEIRAEHPSKVVFLDMGFHADGMRLDFDEPQTIVPSDPDHGFWRRHYAVALDDMGELLAPDCIVLCEGSSETEDLALDEACYNRIFSREFPRARFVSLGPASMVERRMRDLLPLLDRIVGGTSVVRLIDRDSLTSEEISEKRAQGVRVLSGYRNIESMLLSDGVLARLCESVGEPACFEAIAAARDGALAGSHDGRAADDLKPAAQAVHHAARSELNLSRSGGSTQAFMRILLSPLVTPGTPEYERLKDDVFGP